MRTASPRPAGKDRKTAGDCGIAISGTATGDTVNCGGPWAGANHVTALSTPAIQAAQLAIQRPAS